MDHIMQTVVNRRDTADWRKRRVASRLRTEDNRLQTPGSGQQDRRQTADIIMQTADSREGYTGCRQNIASIIQQD
jgi:hypothetical protein